MHRNVEDDPCALSDLAFEGDLAVQQHEEVAHQRQSEPRTRDALPLSKRVGGGFLWTGDPWQAKRDYGASEWTIQYPMLGLTAPYWSGRADGVISEGAGLALGWRPSAESCTQ